jgi:hypothetical protein
MASFGVPMLLPGHPEAASVGSCAFKALQAIDNGILMKEMSAGLTPEEKNALEALVGKGSGDKKLEERISDYLLAPDSLHVQEKNKVASIMMRWFKRNRLRPKGCYGGQDGRAAKGGRSCRGRVVFVVAVLGRFLGFLPEDPSRSFLFPCLGPFAKGAPWAPPPWYACLEHTHAHRTGATAAGRA